MPQIQYQPVAFPPEQSPPTVDKMGWRGSEPDVTRYHARHQQRPDAYQPAQQTTGATVFAVEQWAISKGQGVEIPDNPQQFISPREYLTRGGGYRSLYDTQSHAVFAVENWSPKFGWPQFEGPDNPELFYKRRLNAAGMPAYSPRDLTLPSTTVTFAQMELPDDPRLGRRVQLPVAAGILLDFGVEIPVPVQSWTGTWPDTTRRSTLATREYPSVSRTDVVSSAVAPPLAAAVYPHATRRNAYPMPVTVPGYSADLLLDYSYAQAVAADNPVGFWRVDETQGTAAADAMGAHPGVYSGSVTLGQAGATGDGNRAVLVDSATETGFTIANIVAPTVMSVEAWFYRTGTSGLFGRLYSTGSAGPAAFQTEFSVHNDDTLNFYLTFTTLTPGWMSTGVTVPLNAWSHLAMTWDGTWLRIYLNGAQVYSSNTWAGLTLQGAGSTVGTRSFGFAGPGNGTGIKGILDECALYDYALSSTQIAYHYARRNEVANAPALSWSNVYPATTSRLSLAVNKHPSVFKGEAVEQFTRTLLATTTYPDTTWRPSLAPSRLPFTFRGEAPEQFAVPPVSWQGWQPDRIPTLKPQTRIEGYSCVLQDLVIAVPALSWLGNAPTKTSRLTLASSQHPSLFRGEAIEQFARTSLASVTAPDATRRASLSTAQLPSVSRTDVVVLAPTMPTTVLVEATRRASLHASRLPYVAVHGEALEKFNRTLMASITAPDTTRANRLPVADLPFSVRGEAIEQFRRTLLASVTAPDTTRRNVLDPRFIPVLQALFPLAFPEFDAACIIRVSADRWIVMVPADPSRVDVGAESFIIEPEDD